MYFPLPIFDYFKFENFYKNINKANIYEFKKTNHLTIFSSFSFKKKYYLNFFAPLIRNNINFKNYLLFLITEKVQNPNNQQGICLFEINDEEKEYEHKILLTFWVKEGSNPKFSIKKFIDILKNI